MAMEKRGIAEIAHLPRRRESKESAAKKAEHQGAGEVERMRAKLYDRVERRLDAELNEEMQYELARMLAILETARRSLLPKILPEVRVAIGALLHARPKLQLARALRYRLELELLRHNGLVTRHLVRFSDGNPVLIVGMGLLVTVLIAAMVYFALPFFRQAAYFQQLVLLGDAATLTIAEAAFLGGVVSILARLRAFSQLREFDPVFLFLNALLKPGLGVVLGVFAFAAFKAGWIPIDPAILPDEPSIYALWAIGFLSGFSERFTSDIITRGEVMFGARKKA